MMTLLLSVFFLFGASVSHADNPPVSVPVVMVDYPPFTSPEVPGQGIFYDALARAFAGVCCWNFVPEYLPPVRAKEYIYDTGNNWLISFMPDWEGRAHIESFVLLENGVKDMLFRRTQNDPFRWQDLSFLQGKTVAITRGLPADNVAETVRNAGGSVVLVTTPEQGIRMLLAGRVDYTEGLYEAGFYFANKAGFDPGELQASEPPLFTLPLKIYLNTLHPAADQIRPVLQKRLPVKR
ncbi:hypothetical protein ACQUQU_01265 [Thalassolituus sp. LLYu03]|uniref:hypothetical protein n=1 Tax=Thalassolituus sp. LLYu03 TaxID=3421656 RepID=UPI003D289F37